MLIPSARLYLPPSIPLRPTIITLDLIMHRLAQVKNLGRTTTNHIVSSVSNITPITTFQHLALEDKNIEILPV